MKKSFLYFAFALLISLFISKCNISSDEHFLKDENYRKQVHEQFLKRKELAAGGGGANNYFRCSIRKILPYSNGKRWNSFMRICHCLIWLITTGDFFLGQVDAAFEAREYFDWGKKIPDDVFRHFVLVYRVNNENLDTARQVFFDELKDRVKGLTMEQAVLEVNHWCHEKVTYKGTDGRTSSPLALVKTSWGGVVAKNLLLQPPLCVPWGGYPHGNVIPPLGAYR